MNDNFPILRVLKAVYSANGRSFAHALLRGK
jgi:hypothetical protein